MKRGITLVGGIDPVQDKNAPQHPPDPDKEADVVEAGAPSTALPVRVGGVVPVLYWVRRKNA